MSILTVLRLWENSQIRTTVKSSGTSAEMDITDFKRALEIEIGSVTFILTGKKFHEVLNDAIDRVVATIKEEGIDAFWLGEEEVKWIGEKVKEESSDFHVRRRKLQ